MTWKEYIEGRKWYRGTKASEDPKKRKAKTTFWLPDKKDGRGYADPVRFDRKHDMQLITAKIIPSKLFVGNEPAMVRKLDATFPGIWKEYTKLIREGKKWDPETDELVNEAARKVGYDVQAIAKDQLQVFNPKAIKILKVEKVSQWHGLRVPPGTYYASGGRISRKPRRGWRKVKFA